MKRFILLFIILILTLSLSGCGIFDLDNWVTPDDTEFLACIKELDTPEKICLYMEDNFTYEAHLLNILTPYQLYITQAGDCDDTANFAMFIANYHNYKTYLLKICYSNFPYKHYIAIYKENGLYNFSDNQYYFPVNYDNFSDIVKLDSQWMYNCYGYILSKYIVYDYWNNIIEQGTK